MEFPTRSSSKQKHTEVSNPYIHYVFNVLLEATDSSKRYNKIHNPDCYINVDVCMYVCLIYVLSPFWYDGELEYDDDICFTVHHEQ